MDMEKYLNRCARLEKAAKELYTAAYWSCSKSKLSLQRQIDLWENLRKAAAIKPTTATKLGVGAVKIKWNN